MAGIDEPRHGRTRRDVGLHPRRRVVPELEEEVAQPEPGQERALRGAAEELEPGATCRPVDGGEVDVRRQVLAADGGEGIVAGAVVAVRHERARSAPRRVERRGIVPVVDDDDRPARGQLGGGASHEGRPAG
jgi:hypothetical protein